MNGLETAILRSGTSKLDTGEDLDRDCLKDAEHAFWVMRKMGKGRNKALRAAIAVFLNRARQN